MHSKSLSGVVSLLAAACALFASPIAEAAPTLRRGIYWNFDASATLGAQDSKIASSLKLLEDYQIDDVHIFLNDNDTKSQTCLDTYTSNPDDRPYFSSSQLKTFIKALNERGKTVTLMISPKVPSAAYIKSLADGPLAVAKEFGGLRVELDLEGNWAEKARNRLSGTAKHCRLLSMAKANAALLAAITRATSKLTVSTTGAKARLHPELTAAADTISPQLYDTHWGFGVTATQTGLAWFDAHFAGKTIVPALSVECSPYHQRKHGCSADRVDKQVAEIAARNHIDPVRYPAYVIWAGREARPCPHDVCSLFGDSYLRKPPEAGPTGAAAH